MALFRLCGNHLLKSSSLLSSSVASLSSPLPSPFSSLSGRRNHYSSTTESFVTGTSANYEEQMFESWKRDPTSVHASWAAYFNAIDHGLSPEQAHTVPQNIGLDETIRVPLSAIPSAPAPAAPAAPAAAPVRSAPGTMSPAEIQDSIRLYNLARAFGTSGHHIATLDPLPRPKDQSKQPRFVPKDLDPSYWGFKEEDLNRPIPIGDHPPVRAFEGRTHVTVNEATEELKRIYCGNVAIEYSHVKDREMRRYLKEWMEQPVTPPSKEERMRILDRLAWSDMFENFLATKYGGAKRFGLEGCESLIPGFKALIDTAADDGCREMMIGMPHRGRLNTLANVIRKPLPAIFCEFKGLSTSEGGVSGDVKYHLGTSSKRSTNNGKKIGLSMAANPSHLEAVNPVVCGRTRARQDYFADHDGKSVCAVLMHGDAAFAGQGVVYESLHLNDLPEYTTRGTIHIVVNNQIGFTTDPMYARSTPHPTDVAKNVNAPIFHVNADDVEAVVRVFNLAAHYRQKFSDDVVIDLIGYRRHGHNEIDPAEMTQPLMYQVIAKHPSGLKIYEKFLMQEGVCTQGEINEVKDKIKATLEKGFEDAKTYSSKDTEWQESRWKDLKQLWEETDRPRATNFPESRLQNLGKTLTTVPEGFTLHKQLKKLLEKKREMFETGKGFDWGTAEALAFGSLVEEGNLVRLSGQDSERGTFSHRHAVLHDQKTGDAYSPLKRVKNDQATGFSVTNSSLSEFAVMGFDLGYSLEDPNSLVMWEGQFGDFSNGAQIIIDQFISAGEQKWNRQSGMVLLLPHGYDGQGPEHSSARLERFLAMTDTPNNFPDLSTLEKRQAYVHSVNWQVCNVTNPANYFHLLRRQIHRPFRKPLVLMSPKNLLRHPLCISDLSEFTDVELFTRVYPETFPKEINQPEAVKRIVFCTGKLYYELLETRRAQENKDVALVRVEQLAPFPFDLIVDSLNTYPQADVVWCQEEPENMGAWHYIFFVMRIAMANSKARVTEPNYVGRPPAASPATGNYNIHVAEQKALIHKALDA